QTQIYLRTFVHSIGVLLLCGLIVCLSVAAGPRVSSSSLANARDASCPKEMALVGSTCVDRWEAHMVENKTGQLLSPFYPPEPRLLTHVYKFWSVEASRVGNARARAFDIPSLPAYQRTQFSPRAVSAPGVLPHGYLTYFTAKTACEN